MKNKTKFVKEVFKPNSEIPQLKLEFNSIKKTFNSIYGMSFARQTEDKLDEIQINLS